MYSVSLSFFIGFEVCFCTSFILRIFFLENEAVRADSRGPHITLITLAISHLDIMPVLPDFFNASSTDLVMDSLEPFSSQTVQLLNAGRD